MYAFRLTRDFLDSYVKERYAYTGRANREDIYKNIIARSYGDVFHIGRMGA